MEKREEYRLQISGIFGRNKNAKFELFTILDVPAGQEVDIGHLKALAAKKIAALKVKSGHGKITKTPYKIDKSGGFISKAMQISLMVDNTVLDLGTI